MFVQSVEQFVDLSIVLQGIGHFGKNGAIIEWEARNVEKKKPRTCRGAEVLNCRDVEVSRCRNDDVSSRGFPWRPVAAHGLAWPPVAAHGFP